MSPSAPVVLVLDGPYEMNILFPSRAAAAFWIGLHLEVKEDAKVLFPCTRAAEGHYDRMSEDEKEFGEKWLHKVDALRQTGVPLPPTIKVAEDEYKAIKRGDIPSVGEN